MSNSQVSIYEAIIIGAGPAGLTAGMYTSRARLRTLIIEKEAIGGELANRDIIENYPGYPDGIQGPDLATHMAQHVMNYGAEIQFADVKEIVVEKNYRVVRTNQGDFNGKGIIVAGGAHPKKLGVDGELKFNNKGVFYCAACDGPGFIDKVVVVVGGGNSGVTEALFLSRFVSKVIVIEFLPNITATKILQEKVFSNPKIEVKCGIKIEAILGEERFKGIRILNVKTGERALLDADGILVHVGIEANTDYLQGSLPLNERGQIVVNERMETAVPGVFAAGDIRNQSPWQIAVAVGDGATAALSLIKYLV
jgi:thioredoxin reductase (NADPH)